MSVLDDLPGRSLLIASWGEVEECADSWRLRVGAGETGINWCNIPSKKGCRDWKNCSSRAVRDHRSFKISVRMASTSNTCATMSTVLELADRYGLSV